MPRRTRTLGFSLVEIIVIIVVAGGLGALLVNLLGTQLTGSGGTTAASNQAAQAETIMEAVTARYTGIVSSNLSSALDEFTAAYASNSTVSVTNNANWDGAGTRALLVTVTVGQTRLTTLFTQERTNSADSAVNY